MKRTIVIYIVLMLLSIIVFSQHVRFGIDPGMAISRGSYKPDAGLDRRIFGGFVGGMLVEIGACPKFMIQPEANYSIIGVELNNGSTENTIKHSYFNIPLLAKLNVANKLNLIAGPQFGFLLTSRSDPSSGEGATDIKSQFKSTDFGLAFGGEYKFTRHIFLGARYYLGVTNISDNNDFEMKNRYASFRLGYIF